MTTVTNVALLMYNDKNNVHWTAVSSYYILEIWVKRSKNLYVAETCMDVVWSAWSWELPRALWTCLKCTRWQQGLIKILKKKPDSDAVSSALMDQLMTSLTLCRDSVDALQTLSEQQTINGVLMGCPYITPYHHTCFNQGYEPGTVTTWATCSGSKTTA